jgi:KipI family sensor histidine kinase inhibitor
VTQARIERLGDCALLLRFGDTIDAQLNRRVHAMAAALSVQAPPWLIEITPAYASVALHVDAAHIAGDDPLAVAEEWLSKRLAESLPDALKETTRTVDIPVCYGGEHGPDLAELAANAGLSVDQAIARHTAGNYVVAMLGFAPGFPYLLSLDPALAMPRLSAPRTCVPEGSVGIGGSQTGIYPQASPGGWRLIGRTPLQLFDANRAAPSLLRAGDRVHFVAIDAAQFDALCEALR